MSTFARDVKKESHMIAAVFKSLGFIPSTILFLVLLAGRSYPPLVEGNWNPIVLGFVLGVGTEFADSDRCKTLKTVFLAGGLTLAAVGFSRWFGFMACGVAKAKPARDGLSRCRAARAVAVLEDPSGDRPVFHKLSTRLNRF